MTAQDRLLAPLAESERVTLKDMLSRVIEANAHRADTQD
jgi:hypothetical protein